MVIPQNTNTFDIFCVEKLQMSNVSSFYRLYYYHLAYNELSGIRSIFHLEFELPQ